MNSLDVKSIANTSQKTSYDCIIPLSGGTESTALVYDCVKRGIKPLCFHVEMGNHWQQQVQAAQDIAELLKVDLRIIEFFNENPCVDRPKTGEHYRSLWGNTAPPMFFTWTNIAQLVNLHNPQIHRIYYGFNAGIHEANDGLGDCHTDWVDEHFRSIENVLAKLNIPTKMSAPLGNMSKLDQWNSLPEEIQKLVHTCVDSVQSHCGKCTKCREFEYMLKKV